MANLARVAGGWTPAAAPSRFAFVDKKISIHGRQRAVRDSQRARADTDEVASLPLPNSMPRPRASVVIPLYRSAPFLSIIRETLAQLGDSHIEVTASDRHGLDDTIDVLERECGHDARFRSNGRASGVHGLHAVENRVSLGDTAAAGTRRRPIDPRPALSRAGRCGPGQARRPRGDHELCRYDAGVSGGSRARDSPVSHSFPRSRRGTRGRRLQHAAAPGTRSHGATVQCGRGVDS